MAPRGQGTSAQPSVVGAALAHTSMPQKARGSSAVGQPKKQQRLGHQRLAAALIAGPPHARGMHALAQTCGNTVQVLTCAGSGEQQVGALWLLHSHPPSAAKDSRQPPDSCSQNATQAKGVGGCDVQLASQHACSAPERGGSAQMSTVDWLLHAVQCIPGQRVHM